LFFCDGVDATGLRVSTGRLCFPKQCKCISESEVLCTKFMRVISRSDVHRITQLHLTEHGVDCMFGLLDCMHIRWKSCPVAWQGAFQGKEKVPTIVLNYGVKEKHSFPSSTEYLAFSRGFHFTSHNPSVIPC
jgi:hypothetical protein